MFTVDPRTPLGVILSFGRMSLGVRFGPKFGPKKSKKRNNAKSKVTYDSSSINGGV